MFNAWFKHGKFTKNAAKITETSTLGKDLGNKLFAFHIFSVCLQSVIKLFYLFLLNLFVLLQMDLCQYFGQKKLKYYADFFSSSSSLCCGVI